MIRIVNPNMYAYQQRITPVLVNATVIFAINKAAETEE